MRHSEPALEVQVAESTLCDPICYGHIRILCIKTNLMMYICYIKYTDVVTSMLAVEDNELTVGNEARLWESCGCVGSCGSPRDTTASQHSRLVDDDSMCHVIPLPLVMAILVFYSLKQIQ